MTFQEIIQSKKITELFLGVNLIENPKEFLNAAGLKFEFSIRNTFGLNSYQFVAEINNHKLFQKTIQNGQFIIELGPEFIDILPQKVLFTIELSKDFNVSELYENLVFEIKRFGLNTKIDTTLNDRKEVISESITYLSSPGDSPLSIGFYYSIEGEHVNHFVAELVKSFDKNKLNAFLKELTEIV